MANQIIQELIDLIGVSCTLRICRAYGGRYVVIPRKLTETHPLALVVGFAAAKKMCERYQTKELKRAFRLQIPSEYSALTVIRTSQIKKNFAEGVSISKLARDYGYTRSGILKILQKATDGVT